MALDPRLAAGQQALGRGDFEAALRAWPSPQATDGSAEASLIACLRDLTAALGAPRDGATTSSDTAIAAIRDRLDELPEVVLGLDVEALRSALDRPIAELQQTPPTLRPASRVPRGALRFGIFLAVLIGAALLFRFTSLGSWLEREQLVATFTNLREAWWGPAALVVVYAVAAPLGLPMTPFIFVGGVVFGAFPGALYNAVGTIIGAALSYELAKHLGHDFVSHFAGKKLSRMEKRLARRGFWALVGIRFIPVPFPVVNFGAALAGIRRPTFLLTSALGLTPSMFVYTYFFAMLFEVARDRDTSKLPHIALIYAVIFTMSMMPTIVQGLRRRRRYRDLIAHRRRRPGRGKLETE